MESPSVADLGPWARSWPSPTVIPDAATGSHEGAGEQ